VPGKTRGECLNAAARALANLSIALETTLPLFPALVSRSPPSSDATIIIHWLENNSRRQPAVLIRIALALPLELFMFRGRSRGLSRFPPLGDRRSSLEIQRALRVCRDA